MPKLFSIDSVIHAIRLSRLNNLTIIFFTQYMCAIFLIGPVEAWRSIVLDYELMATVFGTIFIAAAGYYINDY